MDKKDEQETLERNNNSSRSSKNTLIFVALLTFIITILVMGAGFYFWQDSRMKSSEEVFQERFNQLQKQVAEVKEDQTGSQSNFSTETEERGESETDWSFYEDKRAGFSLRYPKEIKMIKEGELLDDFEEIALSVMSRKIDSLDYPSGYNKKTALNDRGELAKGNYGKGPDWPIESSKEVRDLGEINGQEFIVLGRFEECDVIFERKLIFYHNDYQIVVTLQGNKENIISENPQYFYSKEESCGDLKIWTQTKVDPRDEFYEELKSDELDGSAQEWFVLFDEIMSTLEIEKE